VYENKKKENEVKKEKHKSQDTIDREGVRKKE